MGMGDPVRMMNIVQNSLVVTASHLANLLKVMNYTAKRGAVYGM